MKSTDTNKNIVIYADDDVDDQIMVKDAFHQFDKNIEVVCLPNGLKAVEYLTALTPSDIMPCLVILDINMPVMNGKKALEEIRGKEKFKSLPVILFTTSSSPADEAFAYVHKAGFVTKPLAITDLAAIAANFISYCSQEMTNRN